MVNTDNDRTRQLEDNAVNASVSWIRNGVGYFTMERAVNEYLDVLGANKAPADRPDFIAGRRMLGIQRIAIGAIPSLDHDQLQRLDVRLKEIAGDIPAVRGQQLHR
ncbi:MAG: hypothetical protein MJZ12_07510 [Prevotella sp.]|nr:hypothetical protein [Prevotella sp.]